MTSKTTRRVAVVLGAGGPVGHAYHAGVLCGLQRALGWTPDSAELLVGTSAGAQVAALLRAGMHTRDLMARCAGTALSSHGADIAACFVRPHGDGPVDGYRRRWLRPAAPGYLLRALMRPWTLRLRRVLAAMLPRGGVCLSPQIDGLRRLFGKTWPTRRLWLTAVNLLDGRRVAFGQPEAPSTDVGSAVASSGAVPALCAPVMVGGLPYVDGGFASTTNLDLLYGRRFDLVVVSAPLSMYRALRPMLRARVRRLRREGSRVVVFEPRGEVRARMGWNCMDARRVPAVTRLAHDQALAALERPALQRTLAEVL